MVIDNPVVMDNPTCNRLVQEPIEKNIIMCLTTGRSGTNLLQELLALAQDICSEHEPAPRFHDVLAEVRHDPMAAISFVRDIKLPDIMARPGANYAETSCLFGKGFFEAFVALGIPFRLIVLNRHPRQVAKSYWRLKAVPARTARGDASLLRPDQPGVIPMPGWQRMSDYQLCFWYCLEIERRKAAYKQECKRIGIPVFETSIEELRDWTRFKSLCEELGLCLAGGVAEEHRNIMAVKVNHIGKSLPRFKFSPFAWEEERVWKALGEQGRVLRAEVETRYRTAAPQAWSWLFDIVPIEDIVWLVQKIRGELKASPNKPEVLRRLASKGWASIRRSSRIDVKRGSASVGGEFPRNKKEDFDCTVIPSDGLPPVPSRVQRSRS